MSGSHLKGIVSERDVLTARTRYAERLDTMAIEDICDSEVLRVGPLDPVNEDARQMLARQMDSAVIVDGVSSLGSSHRPTHCGHCAKYLATSAKVCPSTCLNS